MEKEKTGVKPAPTTATPIPVGISPPPTAGATVQKESMHELCHKHMHRYVKVQTMDGCVYQGVIECVDHEHLYLAVPMAGCSVPYMTPSAAPYGYYPYAGTPYALPPYVDTAYSGYYPGYYYPYGYGRRFNQLVLPLAVLIALALIPYY
ncbi:hypothetical protein LQV63_00380 [Paenibacillus profundus]|uniref:Spore coat protein n=1 Tax=Paenibacillus profundus TaxID=1173085 RepID=A0ABS8YBS7_9BACL|nr:hypothetical protein [Paenibacillus profundus]MCE5167775.1 hypothetical protein [Paenibacillus profundus]